MKKLSPRQAEVLRRLAGGQKQTAIASELKIAVRTVEIYLERSKRKLRAGTTLQAVILFLRG